MSKIRDTSEKIRYFILTQVDQHSHDIAKLTATKFNITRQAVNKHLQNLVKESALTVKGSTRSKEYKLATQVEWRKNYKITPELREDIIWREDIKTILGTMPENVDNIWHYGFTEMFNNAIDHSGGKEITVVINKNAQKTTLWIHDNGIGIFQKIQKALNLLDERQALFELSKGKLTTNPKHHSGEGIFFTSRMFDEYDILSHKVSFSHNFSQERDWIFEDQDWDDLSGTAVIMTLNNHTSRKIKKIFDEYAAPEGDYGFDKTVVPVILAQYGHENLISRSQAKRLLARLDKFKFVIFDFSGVELIGQAFADEIFRVFANQHPDIELSFVNTNRDVENMIKRAKAANI